MSIRIIGAGVAGSSLYALAKDEYDLKIYDRNPAMRGHLCAWGCFHSQLKARLSAVGLNVEDYVLSKMTNYVLNGINIRIRNQISIDKPRLLKDLLPSKEVIKREVEILGSKGTLTVNATTQPLGEHHRIATAQYKTILKGLEPNTSYVHISPNYMGYAWVFPLDSEGRIWHLGAGCVGADPLCLIRQIEKRYKFEETKKLCSCERDLKIVDPRKAILTRDGVISIGEAAGTVQPLSGEGIIPSMDSAELLYKSLLGEPHHPAMRYYLPMRKLLRQYETPYRLWCLMHRHPRLAYLVGFRHIVKRAEQDIQPELTTIIKLRLLKEILFGA